MSQLYTGNNEVDELIETFKNNDSIHSILFVKYSDVFEKVIDRINNPEKYSNLWINNICPDKEFMKLRLIQEIKESEGMCFTGQLTRLVNSLVGFYSDIQINISSNDQINAKINSILNIYGYLTIDEQKDKIRNSLKEIDIPENVIEEWITNIWFEK